MSQFTLDADKFHELDEDQHGAVDRWAVDMLGPELKLRTVALRYSEPTELATSTLEAHVRTGEIDPDTGPVLVWQTIAMRLDAPPALTAWVAVD